jgi:DNA-binding SARP family transcriptional activator
MVAVADGHRLSPESAVATLCPGGSVLTPEPRDLARLHQELRTLARDALRGERQPAASAAERIEIDLFNGTASRGGIEIALSDGEFAVVAMMALNQGASSREEWCDLLWPERDLESAARLLKVFVHRIRSKFGTHQVIETHGSGYRLERSVRVDVHSLETLARRRAAGCRLDDAQIRNVRRAFDGFTARQYVRLSVLETYDEMERRLIATGVELGRILVHHALSQFDAPRALAIAEHLAAVEPYDDVAAELLIRTHLLLGRPDAASRAFRGFCRTLHEELHVPPPQHLVRLLQEEAVG